MIIFHSKDDDVVPPQYGYDVFYDNFSQDERFTFVLYEDKGHANLIFSDEAVRYLAQFKTGLKSYLEENDLEKNEENVKKYWEENLDRIKAFEPNSELMDQVLALFDKYLEG